MISASSYYMIQTARIHLKFLTEQLPIEFQKLSSPRQRDVKELTPYGDAAIQEGCFYSS